MRVAQRRWAVAPFRMPTLWTRRLGQVMTSAMRIIGDLLPLRYVIILLQDPWLGFGWSWWALGIVYAFGVVSALLSVKLFRWR